MISIVICSRNSDIPMDLKQNIAETIGCEYELVIVDNSKNQYNIFQAYNEGVNRSKGDILCFMHDDVMFRTEGWGNIVSKHLEDETIGMIGVAGAHFLPKAPMYWADSPFISEHNLNKTGDVVELFSNEVYFGDKVIIDVAAIDGMCMFIRGSLFETIAFDDDAFSGFHGYDMDISLQVLKQGKRLCVCRDFLIEHSWSLPKDKRIARNRVKALDEAMVCFQRKWERELPLVIGISSLPLHTIECLNNLCFSAYSERRIRNSFEYRLCYGIGKTLKRFVCKK